MKKNNVCCLSGATFLAMTLGSQLLFSQTVSVLTWHNDIARTGQNLKETMLTTKNVNTKQFGKLFSYPIEGQTYAEPLYVPNVRIPGQGIHNVVYVATEHDQVYAFDADGLTTKPLWHDSFIDPANGITTVSTQHSPCPSIRPEVGITSTPVIDATSGTIYVSAETDKKGTVTQHLHALDITSGIEKFNGPVAIEASVNGVVFDPLSIQRSALLLFDGMVYLGYAYLCAPRPYHGWVLGYDAHNLQQQTGVFLSTPNGNRGGIWQSGGGLASDGKSIFFMTGDGTFDANQGGADHGMSLIRMSVNSGNLMVADYFTPFDWARRSANDLDLGSGGVLLLPPQNGAHRDEII
jgi:outer membrane protein assembly factor BamB